MSDQYGSPYGGQQGDRPDGQGGQPPYGQPQYGPPPQQYPPPGGYAPQQYPPPGGYAPQPYPGQPGQPYGQPYGQPLPPPQPPKGKGKLVGLIVGAVVVVGAIVAALLVFVVNRDDNKADTASGATAGRTLAIPASISGYEKAPGIDAQTLQNTIGRSLAGQGAGSGATNAFRNGAAGVFRKAPGDEIVVFVGLSLRDLPSLQKAVESGGVETSLRAFLAGAAGGFGANAGASISVDPGTRGGLMRCTPGRIEGEQAQVCAWGDESAFALTVFGKTTMTESQAAAETRRLRELIESD